MLSFIKNILLEIRILRDYYGFSYKYYYPKPKVAKWLPQPIGQIIYMLLWILFHLICILFYILILWIVLEIADIFIYYMKILLYKLGFIEFKPLAKHYFSLIVRASY